MSRGWARKERHLIGVLRNYRTRSFAVIVLVKVHPQTIFFGRFLASKFRQAVVSLPRTAQRKSLLQPFCACSYNSHVALYKCTVHLSFHTRNWLKQANGNVGRINTIEMSRSTSARLYTCSEYVVRLLLKATFFRCAPC